MKYALIVDGKIIKPLTFLAELKEHHIRSVIHEFAEDMGISDKGIRLEKWDLAVVDA